MPKYDNKKALIIANTSWNIHNFRKNIIRMLLDEGFGVVVATPKDVFMDFLSEFPDVRHVPLKFLRRKSLNPLKDLRLLQELKQLYQRERPGISIQYTIKPNIYGSIAARKVGCKCISVVTGLGYTFIHNGLVGWLSKKMYRHAFRSNARVVFENNDDRLLFIRLGILEDSKAISVKGCGIDTQYFSPRPAVQREAGREVFLFIGRLLYDKGIREYVSAAEMVKRQYPHVRFVVAGNIDEDNPATITRRDLDDWVVRGVIDYRGFLNDVRGAIAESDCVVLPSYREAIARALQEGMAMGKPVISTDVAGCREAVDDCYNGYLSPVKDAVALSKSMIRFIKLSQSKRKKMGRRGRFKVMDQFDERIIAEEFRLIIERVLQAPE